MIIPTIAPLAIIHLKVLLPTLEPEISWHMLMQGSAVGFSFRSSGCHYLQVMLRILYPTPFSLLSLLCHFL